MFCIKCGTNLSEDSAFCPNCGRPVSPTSGIYQGTNPDAAKKYKLTITRENQFFAINPDVKININGVKSLAIENGGTIVLDVPEGHYRIEFSCHIRSAAVDFDMHNDVLINIRWNRITGKLVAQARGASSLRIY